MLQITPKRLAHWAWIGAIRYGSASGVDMLSGQECLLHIGCLVRFTQPHGEAQGMILQEYGGVCDGED